MSRAVLIISLFISLVVGAPLDTSSVASESPASDQPSSVSVPAELTSAPASDSSQESSSVPESVELSSVSSSEPSASPSAGAGSSSAASEATESSTASEASSVVAQASETAPPASAGAGGGDGVKPEETVALEETLDVLQSAGVQGDMRSLVEDLGRFSLAGES